MHDDNLMTSAMCSLLDRMEWRQALEPMMVEAKDPLEGMDGRL